ncbi:MAG: bifunctional UDP-4-keto-pentose/UDP-xylose synthase [Verrucomicrobiota bacterium]
MSKKILILGVNGFIGNSLTWRILNTRDYDIYGMDMSDNKLSHCLGHKRFHFFEGDITINREWIEYHVRKCDVIVPLVAIATPALYVKDPLRVFELDFEANMEIVRKCVQYKKRLVFPSTSEIYGMAKDAEFDEYTTNLTYGPIPKQRWIYACIKQLLDRVIFAYGENKGLDYSLFRPFNFIGPKLDDINEPKEGSSRVVTQFIHNLVHGKPIKLVDGGQQRRCFTFIDDGVDCLTRIIDNKDGVATRRIFNIGNPAMNYSIRDLAYMLVDIIKTEPDFAEFRPMAEKAQIVEVDSGEYYGTAYQDIIHRVPSIKEAEKHLGWKPTTDLRTALKLTLDYHLRNNNYELNINETR